jgi:hypothetical protein
MNQTLSPTATTAQAPLVDLTCETPLSLDQAAKRLPPFRQGRPVNPTTVSRWITEGICLPDGRRVRLDAVRVGGRWLTSVEALNRFAAAQTPQFQAERPAQLEEVGA